MKQAIVLRTATFHMDDLGILWVKYHKEVDMTPEDARLHIDTVVKLCGKEKRPFLIDTREAKGSYSIGAMRKLAKDPAIVKVRKAQAIIIDSLSNRILANFYIKFHKPANPIKMFADEKEAIQWLKQFLPKKEAITSFAR